MLKNVIENYLSSIKEVQFFAPFKVLLENLDFFDIHLIHGPTEFGKDFIAKKYEGEDVIQYCFQIKVGNINLSKFTGEIKPQLLEIITNKIAHPNYDFNLKSEIVFATTGTIQPPATISFQAFNSYIQGTLSASPIVIWEKNKILTEFFRVGIEPFFELHNSPEFVSRFFNLYAKIKNQSELNPFDIVNYTDYWLSLDLSIQENKLQVLFESYFFSKLLLENKDYYNSVMFLTSLSRTLMKNDLFVEFRQYIINSILDITNVCHEDYSSKSGSDKMNFFLSKGFFSIFYYPTICLKTLELFSLHFWIYFQRKVHTVRLAIIMGIQYSSHVWC